MTNFDDLKIQTFSGINDNPIAPTASKAGNGSHLIAKFNDLVDSLRWKIITSNYTSVNQDKLIIDNTSNGLIEITLPQSPTPGDAIKLVKALYNGVVTINLNGSSFESTVPESIAINGLKEITFLYVNTDRGWIAARSGEDVLLITTQTT